MQNPGMEHKAYNQGWQMPRYQISSDNTEEERETYTRQKTGTVETVEAQQLRALHEKNQKLTWSSTKKKKRTLIRKHCNQLERTEGDIE